MKGMGGEEINQDPGFGHNKVILWLWSKRDKIGMEGQQVFYVCRKVQHL